MPTHAIQSVASSIVMCNDSTLILPRDGISRTYHIFCSTSRRFVLAIYRQMDNRYFYDHKTLFTWLICIFVIMWPPQNVHLLIPQTHLLGLVYMWINQNFPYFYISRIENFSLFLWPRKMTEAYLTLAEMAFFFVQFSFSFHLESINVNAEIIPTISLTN